MEAMFFVIFVDFSKAFDYVDYWLLFSKLLESSDDNGLWLCTCLLAYWYSNQLVYARWGFTNSEYFHVLTAKLVCIRVEFCHPTCLVFIFAILLM